MSTRFRNVSLLRMAFFLTVQAHSLVNEGKSTYVIILPANPIPAEHYAANELAEYIAKASGAQLPGLEAAEAVAGVPVILLRYNPEYRSKEWSIDIGAAKIMISGGRTRGLLYGVYDFLERFAGVRWIEENTENIYVNST